MAAAHSNLANPKNKPEVSERYYTVAYVSRPKSYEQIPAITLKGDWLRAAGFDTGKMFRVKVIDGCLTLIADDDTTEQLKKLCKQQQRQLREIKSNTLKAVRVSK
ncbi:SymE family type I addiction module toxin [Morganella morganii]|uniref:SymE family type I addiction module toxin n=1 Tax=Morganella morganii TaxID=582 RepID=UPI0021A63642|nr:SymE family type I addiction module toxin [Morganella morganii]